MYRAILVDDDELVRVGLESLECFSQKGFEIIDSVSNASDALESIRKNHPDVVFTDMYMPDYNGIYVIEEGRKICPDTIFVVLSCHNNIDFIKDAIYAGAFDYLLKSSIVDKETAERLLSKIYNACVMRKQTVSRVSPRDRDNLIAWFNGTNIDPDVLRQCLLARGFDTKGSFYLSGIQFDDYTALRKLVSNERELQRKIESYIDGFTREYGVGYTFYDQDGIFLLLLQINVTSAFLSPDDKFLSICERLRICIKESFLHTCSIYVDNHNSFEQLPSTFQSVIATINTTGNLNYDSVVNIVADNSEFYHSTEDDDTAQDPINTIIRYIEENYASPITLDELAGVVNFSKYHLCRKFKDVTHTSIINYILNYRINQAKKLLLAPNSGFIFRIAQEVGFNDTSYFNRTFKKMTGYTPNEFQQMHRNAAPAPDYPDADGHGETESAGGNEE